MMKHVSRWSELVLIVLIVSSCSTTRISKKSHSIGGFSETEYWENVLSNHSGREFEALTAKMSLMLDLGGEKTKVNGTIRIKKGEVVQVSIAPLLGIEVARAEISPDGVLVIDRMNKRYVEVSFAEVKALANADLDFHTLQALFLNELFLPGKDDLTSRDASSFRVEVGLDGVTLDVKKAKRFSYRFLTQAPEALLKESCIGLMNTPYRLKWEYTGFRPLDAKLFPSEMQVSFLGTKKPVKASFALSRLSTNADWDTHTEVSKRYEKVELEDILKLLLNK
jgi:hypothetical protein